MDMNAYNVLCGHNKHENRSELENNHEFGKKTSKETKAAHSQSLEEPLILAGSVTLLKQLLNSLLRILPLRWLLERINRHRPLQSLQLKSITCREKMRVVDSLKPSECQPLLANHHPNITYLDERLDLAPVRQLFLTHTPRHFPWVALDASNDGVWERVLFRAFIQLLDNYDLLAGLTTLEDDGDLVVSS